MNTKKISGLVVCLVMVIMISVGTVQAYEVPTKTSPTDDLALHADTSASDNGWGGGASKSDLTDGLRTYDGEWARGLAFWYNEWHQVTIDFGHQVTFNRVIQWYHGGMNNNEAAAYNLQYWDGSTWVNIFETSNSHDYLKYPGAPLDVWWYSWSTPYENTFTSVTSDKLRIPNYPLSNSHTWLYEVEVYNDPPLDTTLPVITLLGSIPVTVEVGSVYTDAGATALDNLDGDLTGSIVTVNPVNMAVLGTYTVTYDVTDAAGNPAIQVIRTVNVVDTTAPVIILLGNTPIDVEVGSVYTDAGATVTDNYDTGLTATMTGTVNTAIIGSYTLTYNTVDFSGNVATPVTRTVNVVYVFSGFLPPLLVPGTTFKAGNIPVKFQLTDYNGAYISTATATILVDGNPGVSSGFSNIGNNFRPTDNQYIFNLNTKGMSIGSHTIIVTLNDGTTQEITINLK